MVQNCGGCFYYKEDASSLLLTGQRSSVCRRYPPTGFAIMQQGFNGQPSMSIMYRHPEVKTDGWCGEWRGAGIPITLVEQEALVEQ